MTYTLRRDGDSIIGTFSSLEDAKAAAEQDVIELHPEADEDLHFSLPFGRSFECRGSTYYQQEYPRHLNMLDPRDIQRPILHTYEIEERQ